MPPSNILMSNQSPSRSSHPKFINCIRLIKITLNNSNKIILLSTPFIRTAEEDLGTIFPTSLTFAREFITYNPIAICSVRSHPLHITLGIIPRRKLSILLWAIRPIQFPIRIQLRRSRMGTNINIQSQQNPLQQASSINSTSSHDIYDSAHSFNNHRSEVVASSIGHRPKVGTVFRRIIRHGRLILWMAIALRLRQRLRNRTPS